MVDLIDGLKKCGIPESAAEPLAQKMEAYIKEIILFNSAYNLTNTSDRDELVVRHIFDSLAAWPKIAELAKGPVVSIHSLREYSTTLCTICCLYLAEHLHLQNHRYNE